MLFMYIYVFIVHSLSLSIVSTVFEPDSNKLYSILGLSSFILSNFYLRMLFIYLFSIRLGAHKVSEYMHKNIKNTVVIC